MFKTWFLIDEAEPLEPTLKPTEVERPNGSSIQPSALLGGFALWRRKGPQAEAPTVSNFAARTFMDVAEVQEMMDVLRERKQLILEGPPGSGKTYIADLLGRLVSGNAFEGATDQAFELVQFHQSYGYEDFVQGIRPTTSKAGQLEYHVRDGIFKRFCADAETAKHDDPGRKFVLVIDEINRGNIARIFGELLLLLEYREKSVALPYGNDGDKRFSIPDNVYVVGTMNTTDRSLAQIDYALRRRFYFYRLMPTFNNSAPVLARWCESQGMEAGARERVVRVFLTLNKRLREELGEHFQVGHSYFMQAGISTAPGLERVFRRAVIPLLEEYFYNRRDREDILKEFDIENLATTVTLGPAGV